VSRSSSLMATATSSLSTLRATCSKHTLLCQMTPFNTIHVRYAPAYVPCECGEAKQVLDASGPWQCNGFDPDFFRILIHCCVFNTYMVSTAGVQASYAVSEGVRVSTVPVP
jgi:hypothetical protein